MSVTWRLYTRPLAGSRFFRCMLLADPDSLAGAKPFARDAVFDLRALFHGAAAPNARFVTATRDANKNPLPPSFATGTALIKTFEAVDTTPDVWARIGTALGDNWQSFLLTLVRAFQYDDDHPDDHGLLDFAQSDAIAPVVALSRYVFEVDAQPSGQLELPGGGRVVVRSPDARAVRVFDLMPTQTPSGVYFQCGAGDGGDDPLAADASEVGEWRIRVRRSIGDYPDPDMPVRHEFAIPAALTGQPSSWPAMDLMAARDFVGEQLHYTVEIIDAHALVLARASVSLVRERLDPPPSPAQAAASLDLAAAPALTVTANWDGFDEEELELVDFELWGDARPLDECGFYGGDDDRALEEVMREVDVDFDALAWGAAADTQVVQPALDAAIARLGGVNDRRGRRLLFRTRLDPAHLDARLAIARDDRKLSATLTLGGDGLAWLAPGGGFRLAVGLLRVNPSSGAIGSPLTDCLHRVQGRPADGKTPSVDVFQLELVPQKPVTGARLLRGEFFSVEPPRQLPDGNPALSLTFTHPKAGDAAAATLCETAPAVPAPMGGYRLLVRDVIGAGDRAPFDEAATVEVLPPLVAAYRPIDFEPNAFAYGDATAPPSTPSPEPSPEQSLAAACARLPAIVSAFIADARANADPARRVVLRRRDAKPIALPAAARASDKIRKALAAPPLALDDLDEDWSVLGRLILVLRDLGCTADLVVRDTSPPNWPALLDDLAARAGDYAHLKILRARSREGVPLRSLRVAVLPSEWLEDAFNPVRPLDGAPALDVRTALHDAYHAFLNGPRVIELDDIATDPVRLTLDVERRVRFGWDGPDDGWHHDLEWAIQPLDRYHRVRARLFGGAPGDEPIPALATIEALEHGGRARAAIALPRSRAIRTTVGVLPAPTRERRRVAFYVMDTSERFLTAANALTRTRSGRMQVQHRLYRTFPDSATYSAAMAAVPNWAQLCAAEFSDGKWRAEAPGVVDPPDAPPIAPAPYSDVIDFGAVPWYLGYGLSAWLTADGIVGDATTAEQTRQAALVAPAKIPRLANLDARTAQITFTPSLLGSHLTRAEAADLAAAPAQQVALGHFTRALDGSAGGVDAIPVHLLPDLALVYFFYLKIGGASTVGKIACKVGTPPARANDDQFGFVVFDRASWVTAAELKRSGAQFVLTLHLDGAHPDVAAWSGAEMMLGLQRGALTTAAPISFGRSP